MINPPSSPPPVGGLSWDISSLSDKIYDKCKVINDYVTVLRITKRRGEYDRDYEDALYFYHKINDLRGEVEKNWALISGKTAADALRFICETHRLERKYQVV